MARKLLRSIFAEHPEHHYAAPTIVDAVKSALKPIHEDPRYAEPAGVLRTLTDGLQKLENEIQALRLEEHLATRPNDVRAPMMRDWLKQLRPNVPLPILALDSDSAKDSDSTIRTGIEAIRGGAVATVPANRKAAIEALEVRAERVRQARRAQQSIVDRVHNELSAEMAQSVQAEHRKLIVAQYRAAQAFSAATEAEQAFHRTVTAAGYQFRSDILPAPGFRAALVLGFESQTDSEIARVRRFLEETKSL